MPNHKELAKGTLRSLIREAGLTVEEFLALQSELRRSSVDGSSTNETLQKTSPVDIFSACKYAINMTKMIQLRNVPDNLHRKLKSRAALAGMSLSDYLLSEIRLIAARPTREELLKRLAGRDAVKLRVSPAEAVRKERDSR